MRKLDKVLSNTLNSLYMKDVMKRKGWSKQDAAYKLVEFLKCGKNISLHEFMEAA